MSRAELASRAAWFRSRFAVDDVALILVGFALTVQVLALLVATRLESSMAVEPVRTSDFSLGYYWAGAVIVMTIAEVLVWKWSSRIPDWVRKVVKYGVLLSLAALMYAMYITALGPLVGTAWFATAGLLGYTIFRLDIYYLVHNAMAISLSVFAAALVGLIAAPRVILLVLLLLTAWDVIAVWGSDWMEGAIGSAASWGIPAFVIIPSRFRVEIGRVFDWLKDGGEEDRPKDIEAVLGTGDLVIPATLTVSGAMALPGGLHHPAVIGSVVGATVAMLLLRSSTRSADEFVPALTWLATGAAGGFLIGILGSGTRLIAVFGGGL